jgi:hypothetical protein
MVKINVQELQESLNQPTYENIVAHDHLKIDNEVETGAVVKEIS